MLNDVVERGNSPEISQNPQICTCSGTIHNTPRIKMLKFIPHSLNKNEHVFSWIAFLNYWFLDWSDFVGIWGVGVEVNVILSLVKLIIECASIHFQGFPTVTVQCLPSDGLFKMNRSLSCQQQFWALKKNLENFLQMNSYNLKSYFSEKQVFSDWNRHKGPWT